jgi:hypothetical protein
MGLISQANVIARIGALGGFYGIDLSAMHAAIGTLGPQLAQGTLVTVPVTFDRLAFTTRVGREQLDGVADADQLQRVDRLTAGTRTLELELEAGGVQLARTVRIDGGRDVAADLGRLASFGVGAGAIATLRQCATELGAPSAVADRAQGGAAAWRLHFRHPNGSVEERTAARERILAVARKLGATAAQCNLVGGVHELMAKDRDSYSTLLVGAGDETPRLAVRWQQVRWESAIRMALGFAPGVDVGSKLGELSGAFDAELTHAVELVLGPEEPPAMRVAVAFVA